MVSKTVVGVSSKLTKICPGHVVLLELCSIDNHSEDHSIKSKMSHIRCTYLQFVCNILNPSPFWSTPLPPSWNIYLSMNLFSKPSWRFMCPKYFIFRLFICFSSQLSSVKLTELLLTKVITTSPYASSQ
jgi:hypothetical protein